MRLIPWVVGLAIILLTAYLFWKSPDSTTELAISDARKELTASLFNARLTDFKGDKIRWKVNAKQVDLYEKQKLTILQKIDGKAISVSSDKKPTLFKADHGRMNEKTKRLIAWGNVEIEFNDGQRLLTDRIIFDQTKEIIYNRQKVRIESSKDTILANSMHYNLKTDLLTLPNPAIQLQLE